MLLEPDADALGGCQFGGPSWVLAWTGNGSRSGWDRGRPGSDLKGKNLVPRKARQPRTAVKSAKNNFTTSQLGFGKSAAIPDLKLDGFEERQRPCLTFAPRANSDHTRSQSWPLETQFQVLKTVKLWCCTASCRSDLKFRKFSRTAVAITNSKPSKLGFAHGPLPSRSQRRRFCRQADTPA